MGCMGLFATLSWAGTAREDTVERFHSSVEVLHAIMEAPDKGVPEEVLSNAKCILVVPNLIKGGFIIGGKHGRGIASCRTSDGWSAPVGRHASAGTDWKMNTEMLTYSRSKGVFAGLTLEGAVIEQDNDSTRAIYGKHMTFRNILSGKVSTPKSAEAFMRAVSEAGHQAAIAEVNDDKK